MLIGLIMWCIIFTVMKYMIEEKYQSRQFLASFEIVDHEHQPRDAYSYVYINLYLYYT